MSRRHRTPPDRPTLLTIGGDGLVLLTGPANRHYPQNRRSPTLAEPTEHCPPALSDAGTPSDRRSGADICRRQLSAGAKPLAKSP